MRFLDPKDDNSLATIANTTTTNQLTFEMKSSYDEKITPITVIKFEPGETYGPFYRIDSESWLPSKDNQLGRWVGLSKPTTKLEAKDWYDLDEEFNRLEYVHAFFLELPLRATDCVGFFGKVKKGTGFQINLNNNGVEFIKIIGEPIKLL